MIRRTGRLGLSPLMPLSAVLILVSLLMTGCGITAPSRSEGFAELESLGVMDVDRAMSLSLGPTLLKFAANHIDDDPEVAAMLKGLEGVRIRIYEIDGDAARVASRIHRMSAHLEADGWQQIMLLRDKQEETTYMLVKMNGDQIVGLTMLTSDGESEAVVINLMGEIRPERFSDVMVALDVDAPGTKNVEVVQSANEDPVGFRR